MIVHQMLSKDNPRQLAILLEGEVFIKDEDPYNELSCREDAQMLGEFVSNF